MVCVGGVAEEGKWESKSNYLGSWLAALIWTASLFAYWLLLMADVFVALVSLDGTERGVTP